MSGQITDEQLVAFLHGELGVEQMSAVDAAINADPRLAERAELLAGQDVAIRGAFAPILAAEVPAHLRAIVQTGPKTGPETGKILDFGAAKARRTSRGWGLPQLGAMAASLVLGLLAGQALLNDRSDPSGNALVLASNDGLRVTGGMAKALSSAASGEAVKVAGIGELNIAITFKAGDERVCRQFALRTSAQVDDAVACREGANWKLEAFGRRAETSGEMRTAAGEVAEPVIIAVDALIVGDPLVGKAEKDALK